MADSKKKSTLMEPYVSKDEALPLKAGMLKIVVGQNELARDFTIHESLLVARSSFFENAMSGHWLEAEEKVVTLPEDDAETFALYEQLIYRGHIPASLGPQDGCRIERFKAGDTLCGNQERCAQEYEALCRLYVFAEKIQDFEAKNSVIDAIFSKFQNEHSRVSNEPCFPRATAIHIMYDGTQNTSTGRQVLVDLYGYYDQYSEAFDNIGELPVNLRNEFLTSVIEALMSMRDVKPKYVCKGPCTGPERYHEKEGFETEPWWL